MPIVWTVDLMVQIGTGAEFVTLLVSDQLETCIILRCDFCNRHVEAINPRLSAIEIGDRHNLPIVTPPSKPNIVVPLPEEQQFRQGKEVIQPRSDRRN